MNSDNIIGNTIIHIIYALLSICIVILIVIGLIICLIHTCNCFVHIWIEYCNYCNICDIWRRRTHLEYEQIEEDLNNYY